MGCRVLACQTNGDEKIQRPEEEGGLALRATGRDLATLRDARLSLVEHLHSRINRLEDGELVLQGGLRAGELTTLCVMLGYRWGRIGATVEPTWMNTGSGR